MSNMLDLMLGDIVKTLTPHPKDAKFTNSVGERVESRGHHNRTCSLGSALIEAAKVANPKDRDQHSFNAVKRSLLRRKK